MSALETMTSILGAQAMQRVADWLHLVGAMTASAPNVTTPKVATTETTAPVSTQTTEIEATEIDTIGTVGATAASTTESGITDRTEATTADVKDTAPPSLDDLAELLAGLPATAQAHRLVGALAASRRLTDAVRSLFPEAAHATYDEGAAAQGKGMRVDRPAEIDEAMLRRIVRALDRAASGGGRKRRKVEPPKIDSITVRTSGPQRGSVFDLVITGPNGPVTIAGLTGSQILSYRHISARAVEERLVIPHLGKASDMIWREALVPAMAAATVTPTAADEGLAEVIEAEIVRYLSDSPRVGTVEELTEPGTICVAESWIAVRGADVIRAVRAALADDKVGRYDVIEAARRLGLSAETYRPRLVNGSQPSLWRLPVSILPASVGVQFEPSKTNESSA